MAPLRNTRHERFAQELATGKSADEAYQNAGYKPDRAHASRLAANGNIRGRVTELQNVAAAEVEITLESLINEDRGHPKSRYQSGAILGRDLCIDC